MLIDAGLGPEPISCIPCDKSFGDLQQWIISLLWILRLIDITCLLWDMLIDAGLEPRTYILNSSDSL
jgi:hypothetical protein